MVPDVGMGSKAGKPFVGPDANTEMPEGEQAPPVHEAPAEAPQPLHEMARQLARAKLDIGALIGRTDELEATIRRLDRQTVMMIGTLALALWTVRRALVKTGTGVDGGV